MRSPCFICLVWACFCSMRFGCSAVFRGCTAVLCGLQTVIKAIFGLFNMCRVFLPVECSEFLRNLAKLADAPPNSLRVAKFSGGCVFFDFFAPFRVTIVKIFACHFLLSPCRLSVLSFYFLVKPIGQRFVDYSPNKSNRFNSCSFSAFAQFSSSL